MYEHATERVARAAGPEAVPGTDGWEQGAGPEAWEPRAERIVSWLAAREEAERGLLEALGRPPSQRDDTVARMAEALRAAAQGLALPAVAVAAGVPERMLRDWLAQDPAFAGALRAAGALAAGHGLTAAEEATPARLRVVLDAVGRGAAWPVAAALAGIPVRRFNRLRRGTPGVEALLEAAQRLRARTARERTGRGARGVPTGEGAAAGEGRYRLVRLDDPLLSPTEDG